MRKLLTDFTPVSLVGTFGFFLCTHPSVPAKPVAEHPMASVAANTAQTALCLMAMLLSSEKTSAGAAAAIVCSEQFAKANGLDARVGSPPRR